MERLHSLRLLIIDDSEADAELLVRHLGRGGYDLTFERVDTPTALNSALSRPWDLVVCD
jgi:CheY-like chemotaxis protein